jgi:hypothetical protein
MRSKCQMIEQGQAYSQCKNGCGASRLNGLNGRLADKGLSVVEAASELGKQKQERSRD